MHRVPAVVGRVFRFSTIKKNLYILLVVLMPLGPYAQSISNSQWFLWIRYYNQTRLNEKLTLHTEIDDRVYSNPLQQSQFFSHIHLHNRIKPWVDIAGAMSYNLTNLPSNLSVRVTEWRPWQEVNFFSDKNKKILFQFRYRLDERFIQNNNKTELTGGYHFNLRHRFRLQMTTSLIKLKNDRSISLKLSDEVMLNTGDVPRIFDQNRLSGSLEYQMSDRWSIESGYVNLIQPITDSEFYERHVIRTTIYHKLGKWK
jgi:hypothetical protein